MSYTKGPWHRNIKPARKYPIIFAGRNTHICQVLNHVDDAEIEANCNLIVSAPELLELLQLATALLESMNAKCTQDTAFIKRVRAVLAFNDASL